jgi:hypothetical protein
MHLQRLRHVGIDGAQELQKFFGAVATVQLADDLAGGHVQRSKERGEELYDLDSEVIGTAERVRLDHQVRNPEVGESSQGRRHKAVVVVALSSGILPAVRKGDLPSDSVDFGRLPASRI